MSVLLLLRTSSVPVVTEETIGSFALDILDGLAPMLYAEDDTGNALEAYIGGLGSIFQLVEDWASDTDTEIGWSLLIDVDRAPVEALPWLAQIVGLKVQDGLGEADQRQQISEASNWKRGTLSALKAAPAPYLTGTRSVVVRERYDGSGIDAPYNTEVITLATETTDPVIVEKVIRAQKPGGIILTYVNATGQDLQHVKDTYATLLDLRNAYATLSGVKSDTLGA